MMITPAAEGHGLWPWMNASAFGRDVAPLGREVGCHELCPWGSTYKGQGNRDVKIIKVESEGGKEKKVIVSHDIVPPRWKIWNDEAFSRDWNKTDITKKHSCPK